MVTLAQLLDAEQFSSVSSRLLVASDEDSAVVQKALSMLLVINYDLPETPEHYMQRIKCCKGASAAGLNLISSRSAEGLDTARPGKLPPASCRSVVDQPVAQGR